MDLNCRPPSQINLGRCEAGDIYHRPKEALIPASAADPELVDLPGSVGQGCEVVADRFPDLASYERPQDCLLSEGSFQAREQPGAAGSKQDQPEQGRTTTGHLINHFEKCM